MAALTAVARSAWNRSPLAWRQAIIYGLIGGMSLLTDVALFSFLTLIAGLHYLVANVVSFATVSTLNFLANRRYTFHLGGGPRWAEYSRYLSVAVIGLVLNSAVLALLIEIFSVPRVPAKLVAAALVFFWNFGMNRRWTFRV